MLFTDEVRNMEEIVPKLESTVTKEGKIKLAVVCFVFDEIGRLILLRRGPGARDEVGKLQAIGGAVNSTDENFREALARELREEAGSLADIRIDNFIGALEDAKYDLHTNEYINWIILAYRGTLVSGSLVNEEQTRAIGFEKAYPEDFKKEDLSITAYNFINEILKTSQKN